MNENIDLTKILKDCPKGFQLYSPIFGIVYLKSVTPYYVHITTIREVEVIIAKNGRYFSEYEDSECILFPSKGQRDWSKFVAPWYKKEKFDPKTLKPFDKVLVKDIPSHYWNIGLFSHCIENDTFHYKCLGDIFSYRLCIPYNDDTKHLIGTTGEAPEYYRYWED